MFAAISNGLNYLSSLEGGQLLTLFWFTVLFDVPRYFLSFLAVCTLPSRHRNKPDTHAPQFRGRVSVVVAGYNEEDSIERCIQSLHEQSRVPDEIVVISDGSTDQMPAKLRDLLRRGLIDQAHCTHLRAGKASARNLAERWATGDIIVNVDCDCTYHRHALKRIVEPFSNPGVGAVCGNILPRNSNVSVIASFQAIEYMISHSLGKQAQMMTDQVVCASGAFASFRRTAIDSVDGSDAGGGEDLDITLRMRKKGWKIHFAPDSICYTDVPETLKAFINQRFRWERDAVRLRYRKHLSLMNPFSHRFMVSEMIHELDFLFFHIIGAAAMPFYLVWLFMTYGDLAFSILIAVQAGLLVLDLCSFVMSALATPQTKNYQLLPYMLGFGLFNGVFMRFLRLAAYLQEWLFNASVTDSYVPQKVQIMRKW